MSESIEKCERLAEAGKRRVDEQKKKPETKRREFKYQETRCFKLTRSGHIPDYRS